MELMAGEREKFMKEMCAAPGVGPDQLSPSHSERDPHFRLDDIHDLTKDQIRERTMAKFAS